MVLKPSLRPARTSGPALGLACALLAAGAPAFADEFDTFNVFLSESYAHDNNLFRLPDGIDPTAVGLSKSKRADNIRTDAVGLTLDKEYSLQRFHLGAKLADNHFSNYNFLDYTTKNFDGRWNWSLTPNITGLLGAERAQSLNSFADYQTYIRNVRTTDTVRGNAEFGSLGALRFVAGISQSKTTNDQLVQQEGDYRTRNAEGGVRYLTTADSWIGYTYREGWIDWTGRALDPVNLYDTGAKQVDNEINASWRATGQASVDGAVARIHRSHDNFADRDFSGTNGRLGVNWLPTAALQIRFNAKREYSTWWTSITSYVVTDTVSLIPVWAITEKVTVRGQIDHATRDFRGPLPGAPAGEARHDTTGSAQIGLDWTPIRSLTLGTAVQKSRRSSNYPGLDFSDTTTSVNAQLTF